MPYPSPSAHQDKPSATPSSSALTSRRNSQYYCQPFSASENFRFSMDRIGVAVIQALFAGTAGKIPPTVCGNHFQSHSFHLSKVDYFAIHSEAP